MYILGTKLFVYLSLLIHMPSAKKIIGGRNAKQGEFPYAIRIDGGEMCGGSLMTLKRFVTAAHCFVRYKYGQTDPVWVRDLSISFAVAGTIYHLEETGGFQWRDIIDYKMAEGAGVRKSGSLLHDIAVGELDKALVQTDTVKPMPVKTLNPKKFKEAWDDLVISRTTCLIMGWGTTKLDKTPAGKYEPYDLSDVLKVIEMIPWPDADCSKRVWKGDLDLTSKGDICCSPVKLGEGILPGDSGSALVCSGTVWGVVSAYDDENPAQNSTAHLYLFYNYIEELDIDGAITTTAHVNPVLKLIPSALTIYLILQCFYH